MWSWMGGGGGCACPPFKLIVVAVTAVKLLSMKIALQLAVAAQSCMQLRAV